MVAHVDVFISILQDRHTVHTSGSLHEVGLVTGIMCNMGLTEASLTADEELGQEEIQLRGPLARIQRLMIGLFPRYCSSDSWEKVSCIWSEKGKSSYKVSLSPPEWKNLCLKILCCRISCRYEVISLNQVFPPIPLTFRS